MPKKKNSGRAQAPLYRKPPPKAASQQTEGRSPQSTVHSQKPHARPSTVDSRLATVDFSHPHFLAPAHFELREDGTIKVAQVSDLCSKPTEQSSVPQLIFRSESVTGNELRLMAKVDFSADLPKALQRHGYFILPVKNGEYVLVRGNG